MERVVEMTMNVKLVVVVFETVRKTRGLCY